MTRIQILCSVAGAMAAVVSAAIAWLNYSINTETKSHNERAKIVADKGDFLVSDKWTNIAERDDIIDASKCANPAVIKSAFIGEVQPLARIAPHHSANEVSGLRFGQMVFRCETKGNWQKVIFEYVGPTDSSYSCNVKIQTLPKETPASFCMSGWVETQQIER